jgi:hypothetical protein
VGCFFVLCLVVASMAGYAGQLVICIQFNSMATGALQQLCRRRVFFPAAGQQKDEKKKEDNTGHYPIAKKLPP